MSKPKTPTQRRKQNRIYAVVGILVAASLGAFLVLKAFEENIRFFVTPSDLKVMEYDANTQFRLGGLIELGSIQKQDGSLLVKFRVTDGGDTIDVEYEGLLPDLFKEGQGVVAEGIINADGVFIADTVLAKHDENYMPPEVADALKEKGYWQHDEEAGDGT